MWYIAVCVLVGGIAGGALMGASLDDDDLFFMHPKKRFALIGIGAAVGVVVGGLAAMLTGGVLP